MRKIRLAILIGGISSERDISLISGKEVVKALDKKKYEIKIYDPKSDLIKLAKDRKEIDVVFPVLHGFGGEDGTIQGYLELLKLPYVGSGVLSSALAMDKKMSKVIYKNNGLLTPKTIILSRPDIEKNLSGVLQNIRKTIGLPCVVKANNHGSSIGVYIVKNEKDLKKAINDAFKLDNEVLVEEYIKGIEVTGAVLGNQNPKALPIVEIIPPEGKFFDREVKYSGATQEIVPARLSEELTKQVQDVAVKAHLMLGCRGFSRTDMIIKKPKIYVLETNTIPGLTSESLFPKAAKVTGISLTNLLEKLIVLSLEKNNLL
ncbi:hypothetical protein A3F08_03350 [Candidatus Berkelbacteria bacterium RIFCSPHIGHO2_12_FULL_36_9]|uniref:D-alanine--D-alanine ligase n=1 Tax=Candidatus Berkelbacteria bacterium RIFCSPHIGHO2_12_FULL_36_9 TaxID=1797469 RepID=A0A1F5EHA1_9BACT|nr:MAG: hypothetical protein A3F08_03350 [Candidatus Berkelbacteria bacterium RIFCSPHIGHO2_12_FULL_36_9]